jgi:hypothetical protein
MTKKFQLDIRGEPEKKQNPVGSFFNCLNQDFQDWFMDFYPVNLIV